MLIPGIKFRPCNYDEFIYEPLTSGAEGIGEIGNFAKKIKERNKREREGGRGNKREFFINMAKTRRFTRLSKIYEKQ